MEGLDETRARAVLDAMQERLIGGPATALGVPAGATADEIRRAFLELTKTYHPAKFARMSVDTQKLSNEVFLSLRGAHDTLARAARTAASRSGGVPVLPASPQGSARQQTGAVRTLDPAGARNGGTRAPTPIGGVRIAPPGGKPATGTAPRLGAVVAPAGAARTVQTAPAGVGRALTEDQVIELIDRGQWDAAQASLVELTARTPTPRLRALLCYARGRQAQLAQRVDEARVELMDALQIDPTLQRAKTALAELFTRRK